MAPRPDIDALVQAIESQLDTIKHYYDRRSGEVLMVSEEFGEAPSNIDQESDRFLIIPTLTTNEQFQMMEDFVESLPDEGLIEALNQALIGKGAFQRFEETLKSYPDRFRQWRQFRSDKIRARARDWLRSQGMDPNG